VLNVELVLPSREKKIPERGGYLTEEDGEASEQAGKHGVHGGVEKNK